MAVVIPENVSGPLLRYSEGPVAGMRAKTLSKAAGVGLRSRIRTAASGVTAAEQARAGAIAERNELSGRADGHRSAARERRDTAEATIEERREAIDVEQRRVAGAAQLIAAREVAVFEATLVSRKFAALRLTPTTPILGLPALDEVDLARWFTAKRRPPNTTVGIEELARIYVEEGRAEGVRSDIAFAQSVVETGAFSFPSYGQLRGDQNNFAGIGACDSCATGFGFPDARTGVRAQLQLLRIYATPGLTSAQLAHPPARSVPEKLGFVRGCCETWQGLTGVWATSPDYYVAITSVWAEIAGWVASDYLSSP